MYTLIFILNFFPPTTKQKQNRKNTTPVNCVIQHEKDADFTFYSN